MKIRLAKKSDLPALKVMFEDIVQDMNQKGVTIWNAHYPFEKFDNDIDCKSMYVITQNDDIIATFGLYDCVPWVDSFDWADKNAPVCYIGRVGVNVNNARKGIGHFLMQTAQELAKEKGCSFLRLMVSDINPPATLLYVKNGFCQVSGIFHDVDDAMDIDIMQIGFEKKL